MKPTSVIIPSREDSEAIDQISEQITSNDEIIAVCDLDDDPLASEIEMEENVRVVVAGEPEGCSGKANAVAAGLEAAENERIVLTHKDFDHPDDWLSQLHVDCDEKGAVSELPFFVGQDYLNKMLEPIYASAMMSAWLSDTAWGGATMFDRSELNEEKFLEQLRSSATDDVLLSEHVDVSPLRRSRRVELGEDIKENVERIVRMTKIARYHRPKTMLSLTAASPVMTALMFLYPVAGISVSTLAAAGIYTFFEEERLTFMLSYLAAFIAPMFLIYSLTRKSFRWNGRDYSYNGKFDVEVL